MTSIGFTGTREGLTDAQWHALYDAIGWGADAVTFHHGDCVGADGAFDVMARGRGDRIVHPPEDDRLRYGATGGGRHELELREPKPYLDRNRDIVDESDLLIACPKETTEQVKGGTWYTVRYARSVGKPITIIWPDGTTTNEPSP